MSLAAMTAPALAEGVQPEGADKRKEPGTFNLWVMSDAHVSTDKAVSVARLA